MEEDKDSRENMEELKEENEILRIQILSKEKEIGELRKEVDDLHLSISYKIGRYAAETSIGRVLKSFLRKTIFR